MTDQEIIEKYKKEIEEDIQNICKNRDIINTEEIREFAEKYKSNFVQGFKEGREEIKIKIARNLLQSGLPVDLVIKTTSLSEEGAKNLEAKISDADQNTPV